MNNRNKHVTPRRKRAPKKTTDHAVLDGPFAVLAALKKQMTGQATDANQGGYDGSTEKPSSRFISKPTGGKPHKYGKKRGSNGTDKKHPVPFRVKRSTLKPLDRSAFDNGLQPVEQTGKDESWKGCADEVEAWLDEKAATVRVSNLGYPDLIAAKVESEVRHRTRVGTIEAIPTNAETEIILGIDFGTTSTKIVASFPYRAGEPTYALPALEGLCAEEHLHLFPSAVWIDARGHFHLAPKLGRIVLPELKRDLLEMRASCTGADPNALVTPETAVAAFLALHIRHARGWMLDGSGACRPGEACAWTVHVGFPAAALDERLSMPFERALAAALILARSPGIVSRRSVEDVLRRIPDASATLLEEGGAVFPEISAAVAGFAASRRLEAGLYCLVDIGGMTLDCCTFDLRPFEEGMRNPIFVASIAPFGIQNLDLWRKGRKRVGTFVEAIKSPIRDVIWTTRGKRQPNSPRWNGYLPIFATGGGAAARTYRAALDDTGPWLCKQLNTSFGARILDLPVPDNLQNLLCGDNDAHRLNIAVGLSREPGMIPVSALPGQIEDAQRPHRRRATFVGAEQV